MKMKYNVAFSSFFFDGAVLKTLEIYVSFENTSS